MPRTPPFSEDDLRAAIAQSQTWVDALRFLGYIPKGGNFKTIKRWAERWGVSSDHFDPHYNRRRVNRARTRPLEDVPERRKVLRPSYEELMEDVQSMSFVAIGRKYGVSDSAVRKWIRWYEEAGANDAHAGGEGGLPASDSEPPDLAA